MIRYLRLTKRGRSFTATPLSKRWVVKKVGVPEFRMEYPLAELDAAGVKALLHLVLAKAAKKVGAPDFSVFYGSVSIKKVGVPDFARFRAGVPDFAPQRCQGATGSSLRHSRMGSVARPSPLHSLIAGGGHRFPPALAADQKSLFPRLADERAAQPDPVTPRGAGHLATPLLGTPDPG